MTLELPTVLLRERDLPGCRSWGTLRELEQLGRLAAPLALANLGQVALGATDTAVVGRLGALELGAAGLGSSLFFTVAVVGSGLLFGFDPLIAQALGAGEAARARALLGRATALGVLLAVPLAAAGVGAGLLLEAWGIPVATAALTRTYLDIRLLALVPYLGFVATRSYLQATGGTRSLVLAVVAANAVNLPLAYGLALGDAGLVRLGLPAVGLPAWGVAGAAWATVGATVVQWLVLLGAGRLGRAAQGAPGARLTQCGLRVGAPIALALLAEYGVFSLVNVLMGNLDEVALAAHQVALTFAAATFTLALGVGSAAAVRVGRAVGAGTVADPRVAGFVAMGGGGVLMALPALAFALFPGELALLVTDRPEVVRASIPLLGVAALFQVSDGLQAVAAGALRGAGDTSFPLIANLVGHYVVGLPLGVCLAFGCGWGAAGLWWGLSAGLLAVAVALAVRFEALTRGPVPRVG